MDIPQPNTYVTGQVVDADELNNDLRDAINFLLDPPRCQTTRSTTAGWGNTTTPVSHNGMGTVIYNNDMTISGNICTINTPGLYELNFYLWFFNTLDTAGVYAGYICINTAGTFDSNKVLVGCSSNPTTTNNLMQANCDFPLNVGDAVECFFMNNGNHGGSVTLTAGLANSQFSAYLKSVL